MEGETHKYPKRVFLICGYCLCERFAFYGTRAILSLYLNQILHYTPNKSTEIYHFFMVGCYFFPLLGAIIADSWLGKFRMIVYSSVLYWVGNMTITAAATPPLHFPQREMSLIGLFLIAFGTGTLKPCLSAFGGDQFLVPHQEKQLQEFFSIFYFAVNLGSLSSTSITPYIRHNVHCFNEHSCYSLAFGIPAVFMCLGLILILLGIKVYTMRKPTENMIVKVACCIMRAIVNKCCKGGEKKPHWLDHADDKYEQKFIEDVKLALRVLLLFVPIPLFWALFEQQGSRWTFQATHMNGALGSWAQIEPEHMQVTNPLLVLIFIPLFDIAVYPALAKIGLYRPLQKISVGGLLAAVSFVMSALLELSLQDAYSVMPHEGKGHIRIYDSLNCQLRLDSKFDKLSGKIEPYESFELTDIPLKEVNGISFTVTTDCSSFEPSLKWRGTVKISEDKTKAAVSYIIVGEPNDHIKGHIVSEFDNIKKSPNGNPKVRILYHVEADTTMKISHGSRSMTFDLKKNGYATEMEDLEKIYGTCQVTINEKDYDKVYLGYSGVYNLLVVEKSKKFTVKLSEIQKPNTVHILWQVPQYTVITMAEIMIAITGLELSYSQAPLSMKTVITAAWLLTNAIGNVIVVIVTKIRLKSQVFEFLLFALLMVIVMCVFMIIAKFYKYVTINNEEQ